MPTEVDKASAAEEVIDIDLQSLEDESGDNNNDGMGQDKEDENNDNVDIIDVTETKTPPAAIDDTQKSRKTPPAASTGAAPSSPAKALFQPEPIEDFLHLADAYKAPLFTYPYCNPTTNMENAYRAQRIAKQRLDTMRSQRTQYENEALVEKLGRLHNLLRESQEREDRAKSFLREKTIAVYETELEAASSLGGGGYNSTGPGNQFNLWTGKLRQHIRCYKKFPLSLSELEALEADPNHTLSDYEKGCKPLAQWIHDQQIAKSHNLEGMPDHGAPHHLATLENIGVDIPLTDEDKWQRMYIQFQKYVKNYYDSPVLVSCTDGDVLRSITDEAATVEQLQLLQAQTEKEREQNDKLKQWCIVQQNQYEHFVLQVNDDHYNKLINVGFTFDAIVNDAKWKGMVDMVLEFKKKFNHVHIPNSYRPPDSNAKSVVGDDLINGFKLMSFINKVRPLILRDALSPKRVAHLKRVGLYLDLGGNIYEEHVKQCKITKGERGEEVGTKRKFMALKKMTTAKKRTGNYYDGGVEKKIVKRGDMNKWKAKLDKLVAYKEKHGNIDIQNDVKLRSWTYSIIRKLNMNSTSLNGNKMKYIYEYDGLRDFLLTKEHVEQAMEEANIERERNKRYTHEGRWKKMKKEAEEKSKEEEEDNNDEEGG